MTPLRQCMLEDVRIRNLSPHTQRAYLENVARLARYFDRSPAALGPDEIRTYQVYLTCERHPRAQFADIPRSVRRSRQRLPRDNHRFAKRLYQFRTPVS